MPASTGRTTLTFYDSDLADGVGLDDPAHQVTTLNGATRPLTLENALTVLSLPGAQGGGNLTFTEGAAGSAYVTVNSNGVAVFEIADSLGRTVMTGNLSDLNALLVWSCNSYDTTQSTAYGQALATVRVSQSGATITSLTDGRGATISMVTPCGVTNRSCDGNGNVVSVTPQGQSSVAYTYDSLNRQITQVDESGTVTFTYDRNSNVLSSTDILGQVVLSEYDARDRRAMKQVGSLLTKWTYDAAGNALTREDPAGQVTEYVYDNRGHNVHVTFPDHVAGATHGDIGMGRVSFAYDSLGRVSLKTDQQGDTCSYAYDLSGRLVSRSYDGHVSGPLSGVQDVDSFAYDMGGRLISATSSRYSNEERFTYDLADRLVTNLLTIDGHTHSITSGFNSNSQQSTLTYPDGTVIDFEYAQGTGWLSSVGYVNGPVVCDLTRDSGGKVIGREFQNGLVEAIGYTPNGRVATVDGPGETRNYAYDAHGRMVAVAVTGPLASTGITGRAFDSRGDLIQATRQDGTEEAWTYTTTRDWATQSLNGASKTRTYGQAHELLAVGSGSVAYDSKGNQTNGFSWDFDNQLSTDGTGAQYEYSALGNLVAKRAGSDVQVFVPFDGTTASVVGGDGSVIENYVRDDGGLPLAILQSQTEYLCLHTDASDNVVAVSDESGTVLERIVYSSFGDPTVVSADGVTAFPDSPAGNSFFAGGQRFDNMSGQWLSVSGRYLPADGRRLSRNNTYGPDSSMYTSPQGIGAAFAPAAPRIKPLDLVKGCMLAQFDKGAGTPDDAGFDTSFCDGEILNSLGGMEITKEFSKAMRDIMEKLLKLPGDISETYKDIHKVFDILVKISKGHDEITDELVQQLAGVLKIDNEQAKKLLGEFFKKFKGNLLGKCQAVSMSNERKMRNGGPGSWSVKCNFLFCVDVKTNRTGEDAVGGWSVIGSCEYNCKRGTGRRRMYHCCCGTKRTIDVIMRGGKIDGFGKCNLKTKRVGPGKVVKP